MARKKLPINILIDKINEIRGCKLSKKYHNKLKEHLDNSFVHKKLLEREDYDTLATILKNYISFWIKEEK